LTEKTLVLKKHSPEFKSVQTEYLKLFFDAKPEDYLKRGVSTEGENKGKFLGSTTQKILDANLAMPFGCPSLFIQPWIDPRDPLAKLQGVFWFCDRNGCICVCCREDFPGVQEEYPNYCPKFEVEVDDCTLHQGDCDGCPSRGYCHPEDDEPEEWEVEEYDGEF
jgi:hypothetical protein